MLPLDPHIVTQNYVGAFIDPAAGSAATDFKKGIGSPDYYAFLTNQAGQNSLFFSSNESGALSLGLAGSLANQPILGLLKALSSDVGDTATDGVNTQNLVHPGKPVTFLLALSNTGNSPAEDVYVSDLLPTHATFQSFSFLGKTSSSKQSDLEMVKDPDGRHISFRGIHLDAKDFAALQYTVIVDSGADAPAKGTVIGPDPATHYDDVTGLPVPATIGSTSTPQTQGGFYVSGPIVVTGDALLTPPHVRPVPLRPGVSADLTATASALDAFYAVKKNAKKTLPAPNDLQPLTFAPGTAGTECYYIHYENNGDIAAKGVSLEFPLPAHAAFYRATFVKLDKNDAKGALGNPPGTISAKPAGASISAPAALAQSGTVTFQFNKLNPGESGDVMVQVIVAPDVLQGMGSLIGDAGAKAVIHDSTVPSAFAKKLAHGSPRDKSQPSSGEHLASAPIYMQPVDYQLAGSASAVPSVGVCVNMPPVVQVGSQFQVQIIVFNNGNIDCTDEVTYQLPTNTTYVSADWGQSFGGYINGNVSAFLASNNAYIDPSNPPLYNHPLHAHTAGAVTITLQATGPVGSTIEGAVCAVIVNGSVRIPASQTITPIGSKGSTARLYSGTGLILNQQIYPQGRAYLIDLGANNLVASGAGNLVASGAGNLIATGGGNLVASGAGNLITINGSSALTALNSQSSLVASGAGNVAVLGNATLVASGAGNLVASGAGNIVSHDASGLVASGGGNLVASGAGNLVASGGGNLVASGAGNIVASGAGNLVTSSGQILASIPGSSASLISQDGGGIVSHDASGIVASGAGN